MANVPPNEFRPFLVFLRAFKKVRDAAFNAISYDVECPVYVEETVKALAELKKFGVNIIPKFHLLFHIPTFCESHGNVPLGKFGDQGLGRPSFFKKILKIMEFSVTGPIPPPPLFG